MAGVTGAAVALIDTHCHLDAAEFEPDRGAVLERCAALGVAEIVVPGVEAAGWPALLGLCREHPGLHPALGLHPVYLPRHRPTDLVELERLLAAARPVAVGEIGLDHFVAGLDRGAQRELLERQLRLARDADLPVVLHVRKAHDEVLAMLRRIPVRGGIAHAFNGSPQQARRYIELGFKLGFGGTLTYARSTRIRALAAELPLPALVLETDAPDMVVASHRGERNSPEYLPQVLAALAEVRGVPEAEIATRTSANAREVLGLDREPGRH